MNRFVALSRPLAAATRVQAARSVLATRSAVQIRNYSAEHQEESFEHFTERFVKFFDNVDDLFELQRGLNNAFGYDLVPSTSVIEAALKAARRVNDYPTAVRIFEGLKVKAGSDALYKQYMEELAPLKAELGVETKEELQL
ncbi:Cytochrome c oxidase subunit 6 [Podila epicladia]|uniref:Cytochrome c oxidase subunit 6, mitochondrial n=1 Tax=Podila minutissima TaxID=64525 RepID=A0A9P5SH22_9FUNG|nr:Cytochrome c oxidase subunit 6 [Mortierella antarctica]KAF9329332.1 Cytochrome c oxidase subunit 6 [Podila minutissima]KAG0026721.1 Cytochrome c oxidase subunit 6 [Podila clonocystis]KAG0070865.1 Cytochrome c oxidase subunit 6 [Podila epicladia]KAG0088668.1 Cytochrome c oxidase subunit 6 [Podila epicladia]